MYDNLSRVTRARTYVDGGSDIADFDYSYQSDSDNIAYQKFDHRASDPCNVFGYDGLERLTAAQYGVSDNNELFSYDDILVTEKRWA